MKVLVACEFSGVVRDAFAQRGHNAWSCDLLPTITPGQHIRGDVLDVLEDGWDLMVAHPPCTYLCVASAQYMRSRPLQIKAALRFVRQLMNAPIRKIAIENPVGLISTRIRKPDQMIHPWMFGHTEQKKTHLWLKNLPLLLQTKYVPVRLQTRHYDFLPAPTRARIRSMTFPGIATAMAEQWG